MLMITTFTLPILLFIFAALHQRFSERKIKFLGMSFLWYIAVFTLYPLIYDSIIAPLVFNRSMVPQDVFPIYPLIFSVFYMFSYSILYLWERWKTKRLFFGVFFVAISLFIPLVWDTPTYFSGDWGGAAFHASLASIVWFTFLIVTTKTKSNVQRAVWLGLLVSVLILGNLKTHVFI